MTEKQGILIIVRTLRVDDPAAMRKAITKRLNDLNLEVERIESLSIRPDPFLDLPKGAE